MKKYAQEEQKRQEEPKTQLTLGYGRSQAKIPQEGHCKDGKRKYTYNPPDLKVTVLAFA